MTIVYHFANPDIVNFFLLGAFLILILAGIQLRKKESHVKKSSFFILSGFLAALWNLIFIFIPAFMFTSPPTAEEIQFTNMYLLIWHEIVPGLILIVSLGIINIIIGLNNKEKFGFFLLISGIISIISVFLDFLNPTVSSIVLGISILFFFYFSININNIYLALFCVIVIFSLIFPLIMPDHYINIF